jgi:hypothetical protein
MCLCGPLLLLWNCFMSYQRRVYVSMWPLIVAMELLRKEIFFFWLERPNLFAVCNNTFSKWWEGNKDISK